jgi:Tfp pilus assembly protein PilF
MIIDLARRRRPTRRAIPIAAIDGRVIDNDGWYHCDVKEFSAAPHRRSGMSLGPSFYEASRPFSPGGLLPLAGGYQPYPGQP